MAISNDEYQNIINAVLSAIRTNSSTIDQLTPIQNLNDEDSFEVNGGKRIKFATLKQLLSLLFTSDIDTVKNSIDAEAKARKDADQSHIDLITSLRSDFGDLATTHSNEYNELRASVALLRSSISSLGGDLTSTENALEIAISTLEQKLDSIILPFDGVLDTRQQLLDMGRTDSRKIYWVTEENEFMFRDDDDTGFTNSYGRDNRLYFCPTKGFYIFENSMLRPLSASPVMLESEEEHTRLVAEGKIEPWRMYYTVESD